MRRTYSHTNNTNQVEFPASKLYLDGSTNKNDACARKLAQAKPKILTNEAVNI
jgi:hypothetical protein